MPPDVSCMVWPFGTVTDAGGTGPGVKRWGNGGYERGLQKECGAAGVRDGEGGRAGIDEHGEVRRV